MSQNHWSEISGSMRRPERCECGTSCTYGSVPRPGPARAARPPPPRAPRRRPCRGSARRAASVMRPSSPITRDLLEPVAAPDLEVVRVVAGRDLERAGAELGVDVLVGDDRQPPAHERQDRRLADQARVALVVRVHGDRGVGQHRLGPHRRDRDRARAGLERVVDRVERVLDLALLDLEVRDRRAQPGVPVDHVVVAVDQALLVQAHEHVATARS